MKRSIFFSRMMLYLVAVSVPVFHPGVVVGYNAGAAMIWFALVPLQMLTACFAAPPRLRFGVWITLGMLPVVVTGVFIGLHASPILPVSVGLAAFFLTAALFHLGSRFRWLFIVEQASLAILYYRMLNFSRASEFLAMQSATATQFILGLLVFAFLLHGAIITTYLGKSSRNSSEDSRRRDRLPRILVEGTLFTGVAALSLFALACLLPQDFIVHNPVINLLGRQAEPPSRSLDDVARELLDHRNGGSDQGRSRSPEGGEYGGDSSDSSGDGDEYELSGIPSEDWGTGSGGTDEQRAVLVVASQFEPVYAADGYRDRFDREHGFVSVEEQALNELVHRRLAGTWQNTSIGRDRGRTSVETAYYSTFPDRVLPYLPVSAEPTVFQPRYYPFSYSYRGVSRIQNSPPHVLRRAPDLSPAEQDQFSSWTGIELEPEHRAAFQNHIDEHIPSVPGNLYERVLSVLQSFRGFQYELGFEDDFSPAHMANFVSSTLSGDCVEFSSTAAILGRMLGIPSRVVTGYLAAESLQTPAHDRGLAVLQNSLPFLQEYSLNDLLLVTTSHRHAWVQFWIPGFGWTDFEPTSYAIPPEPGSDPNERRVVIPIIDPRDPPPQTAIPWSEIARGILRLVVVFVTLLYLWRYGMEGYLVLRSRSPNRGGLRARYRLLLMKLASDGLRLKPRSATILEYSNTYPELRRFALRYDSAMYGRPSQDPTVLRESIRMEYRTARSALKTRGLRAVLRRLFSLRGLHYA